VLSSILIRNIVLIDHLEISLENNACQNFVVLTGETGSGKSILLDALGLAIGYRSNNRLLKQGATEGLVVAEFDISNNPTCQEILHENGLTNQENPHILILRRVLLEGASKAFVNDISVGVNLLAKIGLSLIEIHGQNEQSNLLDPSFHRIVLDNYANNKILLRQTNQCFEALENVKKQLQKLSDDKEQNDREKDYLQHIIKELEAAKIEIGEEEILSDQRNLISNQEKINHLMSEVLAQISQADSNINSALKALTRNSNVSNLLNSTENKLDNLVNILDEISVKNDQAKAIVDGVFGDLQTGDLSLEEIEERLFLIRGLARKFNIAIDDLPAFLDDAERKLKLVENFDIVSLDLEKQKVELEKEYLQNATKLSQIRKKAALELTKKVESELAFLKMNSVKFVVKIEPLSEENYSKDGFDKIRFAAATNASSNLDDINKIASGGELSRFMLALKVALLEIKSVPILIFDEIDAGIGGAVANAVGERLKLLSKTLQILVVTHHPQIAAKANCHLKVQKTTQQNITKTQITVLDLQAREQEVARMLAAENITDEAIAAARKLME
jgi:DNA repair protein RecN (Recombination protein N)